MGFSKGGLQEVQLRLKRLKRLPNIADAEMRNIAFEIRSTAKMMAPVDYSNLRNAIKIRRTAGTEAGTQGFIKGLSNYTIYIDGNTPALNRREKTVGEYAWMVHEHMGWGSTYGAIMPSEKSVLSGNGTDPVGGKFLDRAMLKHQIQSGVRIQRVVKDFIQTLK